MKIGNNQPTGTNQPTSNPSQPAFKMKFSEKPYQVQELKRFINNFNQPADRITGELLNNKTWFRNLTINDNHPVLSIKPTNNSGTNGNITVHFTLPSGREISTTLPTKGVSAGMSPSRIVESIKTVAQSCFGQVKESATKIDTSIYTIVDPSMSEIIKSMNR